ncbi:SDR family oxidoreductase [Mucilaginibacter paludis]|uniref:NmrA family protein n=1 Tax=Mucilaginibacter paludis DSM 18603 TaxID=714943 RepID=H1YC72_9SPHI|nr:NAD(P)H-binding protein [Mucilaginibacter paludis]EHQ29635.1 NmrA family protein [Mucilaginibacter paludis DSM 18603]
MKIIITGSLGNISKPLTQELIEKDHAVTVISSKPGKQKAIEAIGANAAIGTIEDVLFLTNTFTGADAVYCMLPPFDYFDQKLDVMATTRRQIGNYCTAIRAAGVKQVVHLSSIGAHTDKGNGLLAFHYLAESLFKELPADVIIKHARPVGFYTNLKDFKDTIKGKGLLGLFLTLRFSGFWPLLTGKTGVIAANYGAEDKMPWVAPVDIATAIAEELTTPFTIRSFRYIASEELTCNEIAKTIGEAIGKPWLKWALMSDKDMLGGLKMFGMPESRAMAVVDMNAGMHNGLVNEDYYRHKPKVMGKTKMKDFAKEFVAIYNQ